MRVEGESILVKNRLDFDLYEETHPKIAFHGISKAIYATIYTILWCLFVYMYRASFISQRTVNEKDEEVLGGLERKKLHSTQNILRKLFHSCSKHGFCVFACPLLLLFSSSSTECSFRCDEIKFAFFFLSLSLARLHARPFAFSLFLWSSSDKMLILI